MKKKEVHYELGRRVRLIRKKRGLTQEQLARSVRTVRTYIVKLESGKSNISVWRLLQLASALQIEPEEFLVPRSQWNDFYGEPQ